MSIEMLNVPTLARIFSHLETIGEKLKMESVCKKWQEACRASITWTNIKKFDLIQGEYALPKFSKAAKVKKFFNKVFDKFGTHLTSLSFFNDRWTILYLPQIQHRCPNLTNLELGFADVSEFPKAHIKNLGLSCIHEFVNNKLFNGLTKLKSFTVNNYSVASDVTILESLNAGIEVISFSTTSFRTLRNTKNFAAVIGQWHSLRELSLSYWKITDSLWNLFTSRTSLVWLAMQSCEISKSQILKVTQLKNLQTLYFFNVGGVHDLLLYKIVKELKTLKQLNLSLCPEFSTNALKKIGDLKNLNFLSIMRLDNVNDAVIKRIVDNCKDLGCLNLSGCKNISKKTLYQLEKLEFLIYLYADWMDQVDDKTFDHIKNLRWLECEGCKNFGDAAFEKVLNSSPDLEILNVARTAISVKSLEKFCAAKTNNDGKTFSIKADTALVLKHLGDGDVPSGIVFLDPGDGHHHDCPWGSDDDEWTTDDDDEDLFGGYTRIIIIQ